MYLKQLVNERNVIMEFTVATCSVLQNALHMRSFLNIQVM